MANQAGTSYTTMLAHKIKSFDWVIVTTLWFKRDSRVDYSDVVRIIPLRSIVLKLCWHNWLKPTYKTCSEVLIT